MGSAWWLAITPLAEQRIRLQGTWRGLSLVLLAGLGVWGLGRLLHMPFGFHVLKALTQMCGALLPALAIAVIALALRWLVASLVPQRS